MSVEYLLCDLVRGCSSAQERASAVMGLCFPEEIENKQYFKCVRSAVIIERQAGEVLYRQSGPGEVTFEVRLEDENEVAVSGSGCLHARHRAMCTGPEAGKSLLSWRNSGDPWLRLGGWPGLGWWQRQWREVNVCEAVGKQKRQDLILMWARRGVDQGWLWCFALGGAPSTEGDWCWRRQCVGCSSAVWLKLSCVALDLPSGAQGMGLAWKKSTF